MNFFLDTASSSEIQALLETGLIDGVTTNPSLLSKEGKNPTEQVLKICSLLKDKDVSVEVTQEDPEAVYQQAKKIAALAQNVVVKIPCHKKYFSVINRLVDEGVQLNITLVFTLVQALMMCKLGVKYISPFIGRWDDIDVEGIELLPELRDMIDQYDFSTQILAASIRHVRHMHYAIQSGADVITLPIEVFEKAVTHPLTDRGIERFSADWQKLGIKQFP